MVIKVLGSGCKKCIKLHDNVQKAIEQFGIEDVTVQKVTDIADIVGYGVMMTPGLVIDEEVISSGKVLLPEAIKKLIDDKK